MQIENLITTYKVINYKKIEIANYKKLRSNPLFIWNWTRFFIDNYLQNIYNLFKNGSLVLISSFHFIINITKWEGGDVYGSKRIFNSYWNTITIVDYT